MNSFSFSYAWPAQSLPRETRMWTPFILCFVLYYLLSFFLQPPFLILPNFLFVVFLSFILNLTAPNNRRPPVKKAWYILYWARLYCLSFVFSGCGPFAILLMLISMFSFNLFFLLPFSSGEENRRTTKCWKKSGGLQGPLDSLLFYSRHFVCPRFVRPRSNYKIVV